MATAEGRTAYLDAVSIWLEQEGLFVDPATWPDHVEAAHGALEVQNLLAVLRSEVSQLVEVAGGRHSAYLSATATATGTGLDPPFEVPTVSTQSGVSWMVLPEGGGRDLETYTTYARAGLDGIRRTREETSCGWVVDLRGNRGGTSWSMLAAVAPLLPEGSFGGFETREGSRIAVEHGPGWLTQQGGFRFDYDAALDVDQPVAVLIDNGTASAAEAVTTAFHGQPGAQIIGQRTAGLATGNISQPLADGSTILLTTAWMVDADGKHFPEGIEPQIAVPSDTQGNQAEQDTTFEAAADWLRETCS
ncbi:S41 family peptidase [Ornithinimicrobium faecis]|uniref:S41 family peptidase n=1 Tax=Ornithinimicrobium faecis TaxID=2934158 RepID=UPI002118E8DE|nr:S41 family peptidase [Ornithinimicrobium sp. HY1745]